MMIMTMTTMTFQYPSYYAPVDDLYEAMKPVDRETGLPRGYFLLSRNPARQAGDGSGSGSGSVDGCGSDGIGRPSPLSICKLTQSIGVSNPRLANLFCHELPERIAHERPQSLVEAVLLVLQAVPAEYSALIRLTDVASIADLAAPKGGQRTLRDQFQTDLVRLLADTQMNPLYQTVHRAFQLGSRSSTTSFSSLSSSSLSSSSSTATRTTSLDDSSTTNTALATIFLLASPREIFRTLDPGLLRRLDDHRDVTKMSPLMRDEVTRIADQLSSLINDYCQCRNKQKAYHQLPALRLIESNRNE